MRKLVLALSVLAFAACKGDVGPTGPAGPAGADASFSADTVQIPTGNSTATITFTNAKVETSIINCFTSLNLSGPWLFVATDSNLLLTMFCRAQNVGADVEVVIINGVSEWYLLATLARAP